MTREERIVALAQAIGTDVKALLARSHQNLLYNASFQMNQRAVVAGSFAAGAYALDRWKAGSAGCTLAFAASTAPRSVQITAGSLLQILPADDLEQGRQYTLSWKGNAQARIGTGVYSASPITFTQGSANLQIEFTAGTVSEPMLAIGSMAGFYEPESPSANLQRCARFFFAYSGRAGVNPWAALLFFRTYSATAGTWAMPVPTMMRATPTITYTGRLYAFFSGSSGAYDVSMGFYAYSYGPSSIEGDVMFSSAVVANAVGLIRGNGSVNTVTPIMYFNAEL